jgi:hypothetical protein
LADEITARVIPPRMTPSMALAITVVTPPDVLPTSRPPGPAHRRTPEADSGRGTEAQRGSLCSLMSLADALGWSVGAAGGGCTSVTGWKRAAACRVCARPGSCASLIQPCLSRPKPADWAGQRGPEPPGGGCELIAAPTLLAGAALPATPLLTCRVDYFAHPQNAHILPWLRSVTGMRDIIFVAPCNYGRRTIYEAAAVPLQWLDASS